MHVIHSPPLSLQKKPHLSKAALGGHAACLTALVTAGARCDVADAVGATPMHHAASSGALEALTVLILQFKLSVGVRDNAGFTPLHRAALGTVGMQPRNAVRVFRLLLARSTLKLHGLSRRAIANADTDLGDTPLHLLCATASRLNPKLAERLCFLLLKSGAVPSIVNSSGQSALVVARRSDAPEGVIKLLDFAITQKIQRSKERDGFIFLFRALLFF